MKGRGSDDLNFSVLTLKQLVLIQCTLSAHTFPVCVCVCVYVLVCICIYLVGIAQSKIFFLLMKNWQLLCLSLLTFILFYLFPAQGSYGVVKLAYNEDDNMYYVSPLHTNTHVIFPDYKLCLCFYHFCLIHFHLTHWQALGWSNRLVAFTGVIYFKTSANENIVGTAIRLLEPFCLLQFSLNCMILTGNDMRIILTFLPSDKALMSRLVIISLP